MIFATTPVVQFRKVADFLADLDAGHVVGVWHECFLRRERPPLCETVARALVVTAGVVEVTHVASFTVRHAPLYDGGGRVLDGEAVMVSGRRTHEGMMADLRERLVEIGVVEAQVRAGWLTIPSMYPEMGGDGYEYREVRVD